MKLFFSICLGLWMSIAAHAASFTVNSGADTNDANVGDGICSDASGGCTLRAAVQEANATPGADTISFASSGGTTFLSLGDIFVTDSIAIESANGWTVSGNFASRIFNLPIGRIEVTLRNLTLANGRAAGSGGGIYSEAADVTLDGVWLRGCFATNNGGGIYSGSGKLRVLNSTVENNTVPATGGSGGGIVIYGDNSEIRNSLIRANSGPRGGGIVVGSYTTEISETWIADNNASIGGGGLLVTFASARVSNSTLSGNTANGSGGGIALPYGNVVLTNSTISGNRAETGGGGGISSGTNGVNGILRVINSTIVNNTAVYGGGLTGGLATAISVGNSIVANNSASNAKNIISRFTSLGGNLVDDRRGGEGYVEGDLPEGTQPNLGPLSNNGGTTPTHALLAGSPAINAGVNALALDPLGNPLLTDQRGAGFPRIVGKQVDIGAFEFAAMSRTNGSRGG